MAGPSVSSMTSRSSRIVLLSQQGAHFYFLILFRHPFLFHHCEECIHYPVDIGVRDRVRGQRSALPWFIRKLRLKSLGSQVFINPEIGHTSDVFTELHRHRVSMVGAWHPC